MKILDYKKVCSCGKKHGAKIREIIIGSGVVSEICGVVERIGIKSPYVVTDKNIYESIALPIINDLKKENSETVCYVFGDDRVEPNAEAVGNAVLHMKKGCDGVIGIGSGVINDICKIVASIAGAPYVIVATAPSMDGYASATSSMNVDGLKVSVNSKSADVIIGDTDILKTAPDCMLLSGIGDMLAKYISICEWRIANHILGEYYCEEIAELVRESLNKCIDNADGLLKRDNPAIEAVFEGLVTCGVAMSYAGVSRPASGVEHYLSHIWDMRGLEFNLPTELHGIQCAYGTLISAKLYQFIKEASPNKEKGKEYAAAFSFEAWAERLRSFLGSGAEAMIALEAEEGKYDIEKHAKRLDIIVEKWNDIVRIINEEVPGVDELLKLYAKLGLPTKSVDIGVEPTLLPMTFMASKDIRDKYVLSRLAWDLGLLDTLCEIINEE